MPDTDTDTTMSPEDPTASDGSATTGGLADEPGCGCRSPSAPPAGFLGGLFLGLLGLRARRPRRSRRAPSAALGGLLLAALAAGPAACNGGPTTTELPMTTTTSGETDTDTEKLPSEPDPRFFGAFHVEYVYPGWSTEHYPDDLIVLSGHRLLTLTPDGFVHEEKYGCHGFYNDGFLEYEEFHTWTFRPETGELIVAPHDDEDPSEPTTRIVSMVIGLHPECEESLIVTTHYASGTKNTYAFRPGRLCATFSIPDWCRYTLHWCDEGEPGTLCPEVRGS